MPFVSPRAVNDVADVSMVSTVQFTPSVLCSTLYPYTVNPPLSNGATHDKSAFESPGVTETFIGIDGFVYGWKPTDAQSPFPTAVTAFKRTKYVVPFVNPLILYEVRFAGMTASNNEVVSAAGSDVAK